jgi:hypothetical protein
MVDLWVQKQFRSTLQLKLWPIALRAVTGLFTLQNYIMPQYSERIDFTEREHS